MHIFRVEGTKADTVRSLCGLTLQYSRLRVEFPHKGGAIVLPVQRRVRIRLHLELADGPEEEAALLLRLHFPNPLDVDLRVLLDERLTLFFQD